MAYRSAVPADKVNPADVIYVKVKPGNSPIYVGMTVTRRSIDPTNNMSEADLEARGFVVADGRDIDPSWSGYKSTNQERTKLPDLRRKDANGVPLAVFSEV